jgi:hypothetical protein
MKYILDNSGNPLPEPDPLKWAQWFESAERHVANDRVGDIRISTVFLGLDHNWGFGPPVLWETMIFGGPLDQEMRRYTSRESAESGHREMVLKVKLLAKVPN